MLKQEAKEKVLLLKKKKEAMYRAPMDIPIQLLGHAHLSNAG